MLVGITRQGMRAGTPTQRGCRRMWEHLHVLDFLPSIGQNAQNSLASIARPRRFYRSTPLPFEKGGDQVVEQHGEATPEETPVFGESAPRVKDRAPWQPPTSRLDDQSDTPPSTTHAPTLSASSPTTPRTTRYPVPGPVGDRTTAVTPGAAGSPAQPGAQTLGELWSTGTPMAPHTMRYPLPGPDGDRTTAVTPGAAGSPAQPGAQTPGGLWSTGTPTPLRFLSKARATTSSPPTSVTHRALSISSAMVPSTEPTTPGAGNTLLTYGTPVGQPIAAGQRDSVSGAAAPTPHGSAPAERRSRTFLQAASPVAALWGTGTPTPLTFQPAILGEPAAALATGAVRDSAISAIASTLIPATGGGSHLATARFMPTLATAVGRRVAPGGLWRTGAPAALSFLTQRAPRESSPMSSAENVGAVMPASSPRVYRAVPGDRAAAIAETQLFSAQPAGYNPPTVAGPAPAAMYGQRGVLPDGVRSLAVAPASTPSSPPRLWQAGMPAAVSFLAARGQIPSAPRPATLEHEWVTASTNRERIPAFNDFAGSGPTPTTYTPWTPQDQALTVPPGDGGSTYAGAPSSAITLPNGFPLSRLWHAGLPAAVEFLAARGQAVPLESTLDPGLGWDTSAPARIHRAPNTLNEAHGFDGGFTDGFDQGFGGEFAALSFPPTGVSFPLDSSPSAFAGYQAVQSPLRASGVQGWGNPPAATSQFAPSAIFSTDLNRLNLPSTLAGSSSALFGPQASLSQPGPVGTHAWGSSPAARSQQFAMPAMLSTFQGRLGLPSALAFQTMGQTGPSPSMGNISPAAGFPSYGVSSSQDTPSLPPVAPSRLWHTGIPASLTFLAGRTPLGSALPAIANLGWGAPGPERIFRQPTGQGDTSPFAGPTSGFSPLMGGESGYHAGVLPLPQSPWGQEGAPPWTVQTPAQAAMPMPPHSPSVGTLRVPGGQPWFGQPAARWTSTLTAAAPLLSGLWSAGTPSPLSFLTARSLSAGFPVGSAAPAQSPNLPATASSSSLSSTALGMLPELVFRSAGAAGHPSWPATLGNRGFPSLPNLSALIGNAVLPPLAAGVTALYTGNQDNIAPDRVFRATPQPGLPRSQPGGSPALPTGQSYIGGPTAAPRPPSTMPQHRLAASPAPIIIQRAMMTTVSTALTPRTPAETTASTTVSTPDDGSLAGAVNALALEVWTLLKHRLAVEAERRGRW